MTYVTWKIDRYAYNETTQTWSTSGVTLTDVYDVLVEQSIGEGKDSFQLKINNFNNTYDNYFQPQDKISIARATNTTTVTSGDIIMVGALKDVPVDSSSKRNTIRLEGYNFSEMIMSGITFVDLINKTPPEAIQLALGNVAAYNSRLGVTWDNTNPSLQSDNTAFPTLTKNYYNVPLRQVIEEVSADKFTADGRYLWWVDLNNKLQWRHQNYGGTPTFNTNTDDYLSIKASKDSKGVKNYIVLKGGRDPNNQPIQNKYIDYSSVSKHGAKYFFAVSQTVSAENLIKQDIPSTSATNKFPTSYPFTTTWAKLTTGLTVTVNSNSAYTEAIRSEIKDRLYAEGKTIADTNKYGKLKVDVVVGAGTKTWVLADRVTCTIPRLFAGTKVLRVAEVQYGTEKDIYSLEEDTGTI